MISRERLAALIGEEIVKQNGAGAVDNLGDWHSVHFLGSSPAINLARLAGIILDEFECPPAVKTAAEMRDEIAVLRRVLAVRGIRRSREFLDLRSNRRA